CRLVIGRHGTAVVSPQFLKDRGAKLGDTITINAGSDNRQLRVTIAGVLEKESHFGKAATVIVSTATYGQASQLAFAFNTVYITTPSDQAAADVKAVLK